MHKVTEGGIRRNFGVSDFSKWLYNVGENVLLKFQNFINYQQKE